MQVDSYQNNNTQLPRPSFRNLSLDPRRKVAFIDDNEVELTKTEYKILYFLLSGGKRVYSRDDLIRFIWGDVEVANKTVNTHLTHLRHKMQGLKFRIRINRNNQICLNDL